MLASGDQIINDVSPILNKQVTMYIIVGGWVGLWGESVVTGFYIDYCHKVKNIFIRSRFSK